VKSKLDLGMNHKNDEFVTEFPEGKDWNADLVFKVKASRITSPVQAFADTNGIPPKGFKP